MRLSRRSSQRFVLGLLLACVVAGCKTAPAPLPTAEPAGPPARDPRLEPPPFDGGVAAATPEIRQDAERKRRSEIVDAVWRTIRDKHYDPTLGGVDWSAARRRQEPLALAAPTEAGFYRALNNMLGELGESHMKVTGPGADDEAADSPEAPTNSSGASAATASSAAPSEQAGAPAAVRGIGDPGLVVRVIDGRATVTRVRRGSTAERAGLAPGFVVTAIGGRPLALAPRSARPMRPVEERFAVRQTALHRLQGPVGTKVTVAYLDNVDRAGTAVLEREAPPGTAIRIGHLPPLHPEVRATEIDGIGVLSFNLFLLEPVLPEIKKAMDRFRARPVKGLIIDLRGNPGGIGAMAIPVASELVSTKTVLGTLQFRTFSQTYSAEPAMGRPPLACPVVILTDEGTASTSEMLAAGLQEAGRARVIGDATLGAVLPSVVEALPAGAVLQYVVADFRTPHGTKLEGRGVQPDERILETRAALRAGRDPVLDAALVAIKTHGSAEPAPRPAPKTSTTSKAKDKSR